MSEPAIKKRLTRAKERAFRDLSRRGYEVFRLSSVEFDILAIKKKRIRLVRIEVQESGLPINQLPNVPACVDEAELWICEKGNQAFSVIDVKRELPPPRRPIPPPSCLMAEKPPAPFEK